MTSAAEVLVCVVIAVADGDSLTARCDDAGTSVNVSIRLAEIDAPERGQAFGRRSRQNLAALCQGQHAVLRPQTRDRYGRTVARAECDGTDASMAQVRAGMAWVFDRYVIDGSLYAVQAEARNQRLGLWVDGEPTPPWVWRELRRNPRPKLAP
jgi:endonuclease YncB( thermonuclease family)